MFNELFNNPLSFLGWLIALVVGITVHEFSHAYMADRLGDPTPRVQGRLTLNPLAHLDPLGTLMILIARFGWGKPVQFDVYNLKKSAEGHSSDLYSRPYFKYSCGDDRCDSLACFIGKPASFG